MTPGLDCGGRLPPGHTARPATLADAVAVTEMLNASSAVDSGTEQFTLDETLSEWSQPGFDLSGSSRVIHDESGNVAGYIEVWDNTTVPKNVWLFGRVHPNARRRGLGTHLMRWAIERARAAVPRVPAPAKVQMLCGTQSDHQPTVALFTSFGLRLVRHFLRMAIDLKEEPSLPALPAGLALSSVAEAADLLAIWQAVDASFANHWGYVSEQPEVAIEHWRHLMSTRSYDPALWLLALDEGRVVGFSLCWPGLPEDPHLGWVAQLGVLPAWRRRGLGSALLRASFFRFWDRGFRRVGLTVDAASTTGATRLYESAGMAVVRRYDRYALTLRPAAPADPD